PRPVTARAGDATWVRVTFIAITLIFAALFLVVPLLSVFYEALRAGWAEYVSALSAKESLHAMWMTLLVALFAVPLNTIFGVLAAWSIAKFDFRGKALLTTLIDLPFSVSPVIAGMVFL